jgi:DNA invertase Pin-like site-specific DNA recombinase
MQALTYLKKFDEREIKIISGDGLVDSTSTDGRLHLQIRYAVAEWEKAKIAERVKKGVSAKMQEMKLRGESWGRPKRSKEDIEDALKMLDGGMSTYQVCKRLKMGRGTLYSAINQRKESQSHHDL